MNSRVFFCIFLLMAIGCKKDKSANPSSTAPPAGSTSPVKSVLSLPLKDEPCLSGASVSATESTVAFKWSASANTGSYDLVIKNLVTSLITIQSTTGTQLNVTLLKSTPYSWYIISRSSKTSVTAQSDIWKFYNSGPGIVSYAPYPAEIVTPTFGQTITATAGKVVLDWTGSDADNDIVSYDVYLGTTTTPALLISAVAESILNDVAVTAGTQYYWKIITRDAKGNTSDSGVYLFKVN